MKTNNFLWLVDLYLFIIVCMITEDYYMKPNTAKQIFLVLTASLLFATVISSGEINLCLSIRNICSPEQFQKAILNTIAHIVYSSVLFVCLLWINLKWKGRSHNGKLFLVSFLFTAVSVILAVILISPTVPESFIRNFQPEHNHPAGADHYALFIMLRSLFSLFTVYAGGLVYNLYRNKNEAEKALERLRAESLQSRLSALSSQINPHFFFNALNSLHSLISEDKKESSLSYLSNLSNVFRYILQSENKIMVPLCEELDFLEKYKFMLMIKYGSRLSFDCSIDEKFLGYKIPVLSLLPLVENVTKHNEISSAYPMVINLYTEKGCLVISNRCRERLDGVISEGIGLRNLGSRFEILAGRKIEIKRDTEKFTVYLPLTGNAQ